MKKLLLVAITVLGFTYLSQAQEVRFGATAGYLNARGSVKAGDISISASESGFYLGAVADFNVSENFNVQPELLYANVDGSSGLMLPILGKFAISEKFNLQAGPQLVFSLEDSIENYSIYINLQSSDSEKMLTLGNCALNFLYPLSPIE